MKSAHAMAQLSKQDSHYQSVKSFLPQEYSKQLYELRNRLMHNLQFPKEIQNISTSKCQQVLVQCKQALLTNLLKPLSDLGEKGKFNVSHSIVSLWSSTTLKEHAEFFGEKNLSCHKLIIEKMLSQIVPTISNLTLSDFQEMRSLQASLKMLIAWWGQALKDSGVKKKLNNSLLSTKAINIRDKVAHYFKSAVSREPNAILVEVDPKDLHDFVSEFRNSYFFKDPNCFSNKVTHWRPKEKNDKSDNGATSLKNSK